MLIFIVIILLASLGNLLVIISVIRTKNLRRQKAYYFVVSLAVAGGSSVISLHIYNLNWTDEVSCSDLSVSMGAMVFNAINVVLDGHWMFSVWLCDMYNAMDVVFSTASILNLVCISMYRWEKYFTNVFPIIFHPSQVVSDRSFPCVLPGIFWSSSCFLSDRGYLGCELHNCLCPDIHQHIHNPAVPPDQGPLQMRIYRQ